MSIKYSEYDSKYLSTSEGVDPTYNIKAVYTVATFETLAAFIGSLRGFCDKNKEYKENSYIINDNYSDYTTRFYGGTFDDALNVNNDNLPVNINDFSRMAEDVAEKLRDSFTLPAYNMDVTGLTFDIGDVLSGRPECWFNIEDKAEKRLDVFYNLAIDWKKSTTQINNRGAILLGLLDALKAANVATNLYLVFCGRRYVKRKYQLEYYKLILNINLEIISPDTLRFITCNSLFLRRLVFCFEEIASHKLDLSKEKYFGMVSLKPDKIEHDTLLFPRDFAPEDLSEGVDRLKSVLNGCDFSGNNLISL